MGSTWYGIGPCSSPWLTIFTTLIYGGGSTPIQLPWDWPFFDIFLMTPSFCIKDQFVSITFNSRNNLSYNWSNFLKINLSFAYLEAFRINFLLDVSCCWPPFSFFLDLVDPSFFENLRSDWVHFFIAPYQGFSYIPIHPTFGQLILILDNLKFGILIYWKNMNWTPHFHEKLHFGHPIPKSWLKP